MFLDIWPKRGNNMLNRNKNTPQEDQETFHGDFILTSLTDAYRHKWEDGVTENENDKLQHEPDCIPASYTCEGILRDTWLD